MKVFDRRLSLLIFQIKKWPTGYNFERKTRGYKVSDYAFAEDEYF